MTQIHDITIDRPSAARYQDYSVEVVGLVLTQNQFNQLRELFSLCETTGVQMVPGRRPIGYDPTEDELNIRYCTFTHGDKPENGWYLLRSYATSDDETPEGHSRVFVVNMVFLGASEYMQDGFRAKELDEATNDWNI